MLLGREHTLVAAEAEAARQLEAIESGVAGLDHLALLVRVEQARLDVEGGLSVPAEDLSLPTRELDVGEGRERNDPGVGVDVEVAQRVEARDLLGVVLDQEGHLAAGLLEARERDAAQCPGDVHQRDLRGDAVLVGGLVVELEAHLLGLAVLQAVEHVVGVEGDVRLAALEVDVHLGVGLAATDRATEELELAAVQLQPHGTGLVTGDVRHQAQLLGQEGRVRLHRVAGLVRDHRGVARELAVDDPREDLRVLGPQADLGVLDAESDLVERVGDHAAEELQALRRDDDRRSRLLGLGRRGGQRQASTVGRDHLQGVVLDLGQDTVHRVASRLAGGREGGLAHELVERPSLHRDRLLGVEPGHHRGLVRIDRDELTGVRTARDEATATARLERDLLVGEVAYEVGGHPRGDQRRSRLDHLHVLFQAEADRDLQVGADDFECIVGRDQADVLDGRLRAAVGDDVGGDGQALAKFLAVTDDLHATWLQVEGNSPTRG